MRCRASIFTTGRDFFYVFESRARQSTTIRVYVSESVSKWILRSNLERKFRKMLPITPCHRKVDLGPSNSFLSETWY
jgi:hypothetical protein